MDEKDISRLAIERLHELRSRVEDAANIKPLTARQFEILSDTIRKRTGVMLSPTTLKRLWGYLDEAVTPRRSTLDLLSQFCGWPDFASFVAGHSIEIESGNVGAAVVRADVDIAPGEELTLFWPPARMCRVKYVGRGSWEVEESEGTRLQPRDTFTCPMIVEGEPLYLDNLNHAGARHGVYVCGRKSGIRFERPRKGE